MTASMNVPQLRFPEFSGEWIRKTVQNVAHKITDGTHDTPKPTDDGIPFLTAIHVKDGSLDFDNCYFLSTEVHHAIYKRCNPEYGDLLMVNIGSGTGTCAIVCVDFEFSLKNVALIKPNKSVVCPKFFSQVQRKNSKRLNHQLTSGGAQPFLSLKEIAKINLAIPSLPEQTKIAAFLSAVDTKIYQLTQKKALLDTYKKGAMQKIFSQQIRFKADDGGEYPVWEEKKLGEVGDIVTGKTPSTSDDSLWDGEVLFVTPTDINDQKYQISTMRTVKRNPKLKTLPKNSIMFTCIASIGKMSLSSIESITNQQINSIIPCKNYSNEFVYYAIANISNYIKSTQANTTLPIINKTEFSKFKINVPCLEEQTKIATFLSAIDRKIDLVSQQLEQAKAFKKGLLQQMFV
jgi:type I restriction enzyme S subunit